MGALAEQTLIDPRRSVILPGDIDPVVIAAAMNPSMSSWIALRRRIAFTPGSRVLIMGATGNAGRHAVQIAKRLDASHVTAAGHDPQRLAQLGALGADAVIDLAGAPGDVSAQLAAAGRDVDVVIDCLWGEWTATALTAIVPARLDDAQRLTWIEVGSITGASSPIPSAALRACNLHLVRRRQGSVSPRDIVAELPDPAAEVTTVPTTSTCAPCHSRRSRPPGPKRRRRASASWSSRMPRDPGDGADSPHRDSAASQPARWQPTR